MPNSPRRIAMQVLTHLDLCSSGRHLEIGFTDHSGTPTLLYVARANLEQLISLSAPVAAARQTPAAAGEPCEAHALADWQLDGSATDGAMRLRLTAVDGFAVTFTAMPRVAARLGEALLRPRAAEPSAGRLRLVPGRLRH
jgi:hypothetical protein